MKTHLCFILLAASISAAPHMSNIAELLTLLEQIYNSVTEDTQNLRIETPLHTDNASCVNKIFEGTELLKNNLDMKKFGAFFQKFERMKQSLTPRLGKEEECDTERKPPQKFIEKLTTFIRKLSKNPRAQSY
uniref:Interleukin-5 n=1 Tax=Apteryx owenii TaxID=8824 RepID=A0A8B9PJH3_APTOW